MDVPGGDERDGAGVPSGDEAEERRRRAETAGAVTEHLEGFADLPRLWAAAVAGEGAVRGMRHLETLAARLAELLETTEAAATVHPVERPLAPFLAACPRMDGEWELDTRDLGLRLRTVRLILPPLTWPVADDAEEVLLVGILLAQPPVHGGEQDRILVSTPTTDGMAGIHLVRAVGLPVLAGAARDLLSDRLATATVLARTSDVGAMRRTPGDLPAEDEDPDAAGAADRLLDLLAGLEHALSRRAAGVRGPDGTAPGDAEVVRRRDVLLAEAERIVVDVLQLLPAGTVEPVRIRTTLRPGDDPDDLDVLPVRYDLSLDLRDGARGAGLLEVVTPAGRAERPVLLPRVADLWTDHVDSALRRAHAVVPAFPRRPIDDAEEPLPVVDAPLAERSEPDPAELLRRMLAGVAGVADVAAGADDIPF